MLIEKDTLCFELLEDGTPVDVVVRNSSRYQLERLQRERLVLLEQGKIFLTERGQTAKKLGLQKFLQAEEFEKEVMQFNSNNSFLYGRQFFVVLSFLYLLLTFLLMFIILRL